MAQGNAELKRKAIATIEAGRREIHAEAGWLRHELDVKRMATRFTSNHIVAVLGVAFAAGLVVPMLILGKRDHKKSHRHDASPPPPPPPKEVKAPTTAAYLGGLAFKFLAPTLVKEGVRLFKTYSAYPRG
jgi:hypothetical protein